MKQTLQVLYMVGGRYGTKLPMESFVPVGYLPKTVGRPGVRNSRTRDRYTPPVIICVTAILLLILLMTHYFSRKMYFSV